MESKLFKIRRRPNLFKLPIILLALSLFTFSCSNEDAELIDINSQELSIIEVLANYNQNGESSAKSSSGKYSNNEPTFEILSVALAKSKLTSTVSKNRWTVFAPTDKAFEALGLNKKNIANFPGIVDILTYHVVPAPVYSYQLVSGPVTTVEGTDVIVNVSDKGVLVNNSNVIVADISARNGVIHAIDDVLSIPMMTIAGIASNNPDFSILFDAVDKTGLGDTLTNGGPFTVFAPTNQAFLDLLATLPGFGSLADFVTEEEIDLLRSILLYHVVSEYNFSNQLENGFISTLNGAAVEVDLNTGVMINDADVIAANVQATNGVIHGINTVLMPPTMNLVEKAASFAPEFSVLMAAATKAGLVDVLSGFGPYDQLTVFAPTNQAFVDFLQVADVDAAIATINGLSPEALTPILLYHVVEGRVYSSDLSSGWVTTLNGSFDLDLGSLTIDENAMLIADLLNVQATNGVIHVINAVLMP